MIYLQRNQFDVLIGLLPQHILYLPHSHIIFFVYHNYDRQKRYIYHILMILRIDIDFDSLKREEVIDYVTKKYGEDKTARIISFNTLLPKQ